MVPTVYSARYQYCLPIKPKMSLEFSRVTEYHLMG